MLIGLCGAIGAGKDTVGAILQKDHGFLLGAFSAPLKEWAFQLFGQLGAERKHFFGTQADKSEPIPSIPSPAGTPRTGRQILEILGTEGVRAIMPDAWAQIAVKTAMKFVSKGRGVVLTDARFANEFTAIHAAGGVIWEVVKVGGQQETSLHVSDSQWRKLLKDDRIIARAGDIEALADQVRFAVERERQRA